MRAYGITILAVGTIALSAVIAAFVGCEDEPAMDDVSGFFDDNPYSGDPHQGGTPVMVVSPSYATVGVIDENIPLRVKGGQGPYVWTVASRDRGTIEVSGPNAGYALYTATAVADNSVVVTDVNGQGAYAEITAGDVSTLRLIPETVFLLKPAVGPAMQFTVAGGFPPYRDWKTSFPDLGTVSDEGVYSVTSSTREGTNIVTVADSGGDTAVATVEHGLELQSLSIVPSTTSLPVNGETAWFNANGGRSPYGWSLTYPSRGTFTSPTLGDTTVGDTVVYRRDAVGDQIVVLEDAEGSVASVAVTQQNPTPPVIEPSQATLTTNQTSYVFSVSGGTPPYVWLVQTGHGTVNPNVGTQTVYTRGASDPPDNYIVRVTDSGSQFALAVVTQE